MADEENKLATLMPSERRDLALAIGVHVNDLPERLVQLTRRAKRLWLNMRYKGTLTHDVYVAVVLQYEAELAQGEALAKAQKKVAGKKGKKKDASGEKNELPAIPAEA